MNASTTTRWTDAHSPVAALAVAATALGVVGALEHGLLRAVLCLLGVLVLGIGLVADLGVTVAVAIVVGAAYLELKRRVGLWGPAQLPVAAAAAATFLLLGWLATVTGSSLRRMAAHSTAPHADVTSLLEPGLSLVRVAPAQLRLDQEVTRARRLDTAVSVLAVDVDIPDDATDDGGLAARRVVARALQGALGDADVAFAWDHRTMGAMLVDTDVDTAWERLGDVLDRAAASTFADRSVGRRLSLAECATLTGGVVAAHDTAAGALDELYRTVRAVGTESAQ